MSCTPMHERVLVVEDDDLTAAIVLAALDSRAASADARVTFSPHRVATLAEALLFLKSEPCAAIVLDLTLPDSAGLDTLHAVIRAGVDAAIIVLTGLEDSEVALEAVRTGAQDFLFKGRVDPALLVRSLLYSIGRHRAEGQLRHAQQMEALGRLAGGVAHDFNNLLTVIIGNAEAVRGAVDARGEVGDALSEIHQAACRAATLTSHLLLMGRQQQFEPRVMDIRQTVAEMEPVLRRLVGADTTFTLVTTGGTGNVQADPSQLEQLVLNLVLNARDAVRPGGRITIEVGPMEPRDTDAWTPRPRDGRYVGITVTDDGTGIAPDVQARMYEPFVSTKAPGKGTGLGLSIVFGIVQQSDAVIRCRSSLGRGTAFSVAFPRVVEAATPAEPASGSAGEAGNGEVILLVEDEAAVRTLTGRMLRRHGYRVLDAATGDEALAIFAEESDQIDLVLTDVVLPGVRGPQLLASIEAVRPGLPVLFMSGYADDELLRRGVFADHVGFLKKPFTRAELLHLVQGHLQRARESVRAIA
ncbi:MAG: response regulator [Gemmatimonadaceae bacterium]